MSDLYSEERIKILNAYAAKVILTPGLEHAKGARERAEVYCKANPQTSFFLNQHSNINNGRAHDTITGPEIREQTEGKVNTVIIGLGTSGTCDGPARFFKEKTPEIIIVGFEPG